MKEWGITKNENKVLDNILDNIPVYYAQLQAQNFLQNYLRVVRTDQQIIPERKEIESLKRRVGELERRVGGKRLPTESDLIYKNIQKEYEEKYFGKIIAIDPQLRKVVGIGDSISEAYEKAQRKTKKDQFDFRRVGYNYIDSV